MRQVHLVSPAGTAKRVFQDDPPVVAYRAEERVVDRRLQDHLVSRVGEREDRGSNGGHHRRNVHQVAGVRLPTVALVLPADKRVPIPVRDVCVAVDRMRDPLCERLGYGRRHCEVHVRDPHRQHRFTRRCGRFQVPLVAVRPDSVQDLRKVTASVFHPTRSIRMAPRISYPG